MPLDTPPLGSPRPCGPGKVFPIGLGGMLLSIEGRPDRAQALATVSAALDAGVTLIDSAAAYHVGADEVGHNESLIAEALAGRDADRGQVTLVTKAGRVRPGDGRWLTDSSPEYVMRTARESAKRLGRERIDLFFLHAPDPEVPLGHSLAALRTLVDEGVAATVGVSNVTADQLGLAHDVLGERLVAVQNEFSPSATQHTGVLRRAESLGLAFLAWRPLGTVGKRDDALTAAFTEAGRDRGVSPQQAVLAWLLAASPALIPIPGARRPETIRDSAGAAALELPADTLRALDRLTGQDA
ncbi:aldo/keto reductase [Streptomyces sp. NBC_01477]|uniref:aldo/keto reductase n=1 Tax=Streptomyces sp. NBC_01477 TaxID=2976015 RepID=UPI002E2FF3EC|nr:aldo/keto reductase [Streptomyces sp. NBC_01477]